MCGRISMEIFHLHLPIAPIEKPPRTVLKRNRTTGLQNPHLALASLHASWTNGPPRPSGACRLDCVWLSCNLMRGLVPTCSSNRKASPKACKISGKIEMSHHVFFVLAFFIRRKQRKAPRGGASNYLDAFRRILEMKLLSFPSKRMSNILIIFSL